MSYTLNLSKIEDVKTLRGEDLSRARGRLLGKGGETKFAIENARKTRIVIADTKDSHIRIACQYQSCLGFPLHPHFRIPCF